MWASYSKVRGGQNATASNSTNWVPCAKKNGQQKVLCCCWSETFSGFSKVSRFEIQAERDEWGSLAPPIQEPPLESSRLQRWGLKLKTVDISGTGSHPSLVFACLKISCGSCTGFGALRMFLGTLEWRVESSVVQRRLLVSTLWCWYLMLVSGLQWCQRGWNCSCCRSCEKTLPCCEHLGFVDPRHIFRMHPLLMAISQWFAYSKRKGALGQKKTPCSKVWSSNLVVSYVIAIGCSSCVQDVVFGTIWDPSGPNVWRDNEVGCPLGQGSGVMLLDQWRRQKKPAANEVRALLGLGWSIPFNDILKYRWKIWVDSISRHRSSYSPWKNPCFIHLAHKRSWSLFNARRSGS